MSMIKKDDLLRGNRRALAKAITLIESKLDKHRQQAEEILEEILPHTGNSIRLGITGIPGVGKSTFIEAFGMFLIGQVFQSNSMARIVYAIRSKSQPRWTSVDVDFHIMSTENH